MDIAATLQTALESLTTKYAAACANPKPTYSIDGQSFSWAEYFKMLSDGIKATSELIGIFAPVELRSVVL